MPQDNSPMLVGKEGPRVYDTGWEHGTRLPALRECSWNHFKPGAGSMKPYSQKELSTQSNAFVVHFRRSHVVTASKPGIPGPWGGIPKPLLGPLLPLRVHLDKCSLWLRCYEVPLPSPLPPESIKRLQDVIQGWDISATLLH